MNTNNRCIRKLSKRARSAMISFAVAAIWATAGAYQALAQQSGGQTFRSAAEASQSLFQAVQNNNVQAIANILGGPTDLTSCGDEAQDKADRELFIQKYKEMHRLGRETDGTVTLYIGAENWPFPVPLVEKNGAWRFDPNAGLKEVLFRRIGENELTAIVICHEFVVAEKTVSRRTKYYESGEQPSYKPGSASGRRICQPRSRTTSRLLFSRIGDAPNEWSSPGKRRQIGARLRADCLPGGISVIRCDDLYRHWQRCGLCEGSWHEHFQARRVQ